MQDRIRYTEEEYFKLRGRFAVGRITESEFDAALRDMSFQDAQGRFWMIGANTGRWYYSDGDNWVEGDPSESTSSLPSTAHPVAPVQEQDSTVHHAPLPAYEIEETVTSRKLALPFLLIGIVLLAVAAIFFVLFSGITNNRASANALATGTRITRPTSVAVNSNGNAIPADSSTATGIEPERTVVARPEGPTPTGSSASEPGASPSPVDTRMVIVLEPTDVIPALTAIPTITPGGPSRPPQTELTPAPNASDPTDPTDPSDESPSPEPVVNTGDTSGLPPDVYVTNISVSPDPPPQRANITFTASFLNTNPSSVGMEWRIVVLDPSKPGRNKDWGQSNTAGINVPTGRSEFFVTYTPVTSTGPCILLQVLAARRLDDNSRVVLPSTSGGAYSRTFNFC